MQAWRCSAAAVRCRRCGRFAPATLACGTRTERSGSSTARSKSSSSPTESECGTALGIQHCAIHAYSALAVKLRVQVVLYCARARMCAHVCVCAHAVCAHAVCASQTVRDYSVGMEWTAFGESLSAALHCTGSALLGTSRSRSSRWRTACPTTSTLPT